MPTPNGSPEVAPLRTDLTEITVVGADRTGIVAGVTGLLFERGVNIEDIEQTVRDGVFRMTLHCDTDPVESREALRDELAETGDDLDVDIRTRFPDERDEGIAVLVTKEDHCLRALCEADLSADVRVVIGRASCRERVY